MWRDFQWSEAEEAELNRFGMISSLAMPSFPAGLVKDPALLAAITKRHQELLQIRRKLAAEEARMKEICAALEEMELRQVKFFLNIQIFYANISSARPSCGGWRRSLRSGCTTCSPRARRCSGPSPASSLTSAWTRRRRGPRPPAGGPPGCSPGRPPWHPWSPSVFYLLALYLQSNYIDYYPISM